MSPCPREAPLRLRHSGACQQPTRTPALLWFSPHPPPPPHLHPWVWLLMEMGPAHFPANHSVSSQGSDEPTDSFQNPPPSFAPAPGKPSSPNPLRRPFSWKPRSNVIVPCEAFSKLPPPPAGWHKPHTRWVRTSTRGLMPPALSPDTLCLSPTLRYLCRCFSPDHSPCADLHHSPSLAGLGTLQVQHCCSDRSPFPRDLGKA